MANKTKAKEPAVDVGAAMDASMERLREKGQSDTIKQHSVALKEAKPILDAFETDPPPVNGTAGPARRLRIHVPTPGEFGTSLTMGHRTDRVAYDGLGVRTDGHIVLNAAMPHSMVLVSAEDQVFIQSHTKGIYLTSTGPAMLASADSASVLASGGVTIAGGWTKDTGWHGVEGQEPNGYHPEGYRAKMDEITNLWGDRDGNVAKASMVRSAVFDFLGAKWWDVLSAGVGLAITEWDRRESPNVTIHGPDGFLLGTNKFGAMYAGVGIDIVAPYVGMVGLKDAEVAGVHSASLVGGVEASVGAMGAAEVVSFLGGTEIASRHGDVEVVGTSVQLGKAIVAPPTWSVPSFGWMKQSPTEKVRIEALTSVAIQVGPASAPDKPGLRLFSHDVITQEARSAIDVVAGSWVKLRAGKEDDDPAVTLTEGGPTALHCKHMTLSLYQNHAELRHDAAGAHIKVKSDAIVVGFDQAGGKALTIRSDGGMSYASVIKVTP